MADDTSVRTGQDRSRINTDQPHEVRYWTQALGCSEEDLRNAVRQVGPVADKVREFLGKKS